MKYRGCNRRAAGNGAELRAVAAEAEAEIEQVTQIRAGKLRVSGRGGGG